jgi:hypothetical protein
LQAHLVHVERDRGGVSNLLAMEIMKLHVLVPIPIPILILILILILIFILAIEIMRLSGLSS